MRTFSLECAQSPSGLLIQIWGMRCPFSLTNLVGGEGIVVKLRDRYYTFTSLKNLNKHKYKIINPNGIVFGKIEDYCAKAGFVVCDNKIVCGYHANHSVGLYDGCDFTKAKGLNVYIGTN